MMSTELSDNQRYVLEALKSGIPISEIAAMRGVSRQAIYKVREKLRLKGLTTYEKYKDSTLFLKKMLRERGCSVCGRRDVVDIHHINEDRKDNSKKNLIPLCPTHHVRLHRLGFNVPGDTPTPSFPMENKVPDVAVIRSSGGFPEEGQPNSMTTIKRWGFRPHNYRRGLKFTGGFRLNNSTIGNLGVLGSFPMEISWGKHNGLGFFNYSKNIKVQIGKSTLVAIWMQNVVGGVKEMFVVEAESIDEAREYFMGKKTSISKELDDVLFWAARKLRLNVGFNRPYWVRAETEVKGDEFIDSLPPELIVHGNVFKKVYADRGEFVAGRSVDPSVHVVNYIENRALESVFPELKGELRLLRESNVAFAENLKMHLEVLKGIKEAFEKFNKRVP